MASPAAHPSLARKKALSHAGKRLGHVNPHVTATVYAHALAGRDELAAAAWEKFRKDARPAKPQSARQSA